MRVNPRFPVAALLACTLIMMSGTPASAQFTTAEQSCRATVAKNGTKLSKTILKTLVACHKARAKDGALAGTNCNSIAAADTKQKVAAAQTKLTDALTSSSSKCAGISPSAVLYDACPAPCADDISTFADVASCLICLARSNGEGFSAETQGSPESPLTGDSAKCQAAIGKEGSKLYNAILKDVTKCQATAEKAGTETVDGCAVTSFPSDKVEDAQDAAFASIAEACGAATFSDLDSCGANQIDIAECVVDQAMADGQQMATQYLELESGIVTTTLEPTTTTAAPTTTTEGPTTTTTLPDASHPQCPDLGQLVLHSQVKSEPCTTNADCDAPAFCNATLQKCSTVTELDSGWTGLAHDSDINDQVLTRASLICPGPPGPGGCGECAVNGVDIDTGTCRCSNNNREICDEKFAIDQDCDACVGGGTKNNGPCDVNADCVESGNACVAGQCNHTSRTCGTNADCNLSGTCTAVTTCDCYFGSPFPLSSGGTPACVLNKFAVDVSGTANVDTGEGEIFANLRTTVFLSGTTTNPCPLCGGKCSNDATKPCDIDSDCVSPGVCNHTDIPQDGVRDGLCMEGRNANLPCDINGLNSSFPAYSAASGDQELSGAGYSLDCIPDSGTNVSGGGLTINLVQTTGTQELDFTVDCDGAAAGTALCPCKTCSNDTARPCNLNSECPGTGSCASATAFVCDDNADCQGLEVGPCIQVGPQKRCSQATNKVCTTNADCTNVSGGNCNSPTCSAIGSGTTPKQNDCAGLACSDGGGEEGFCTTGPDTEFCDGVVKANGDGILTC
ncbi:MAG TPA: hypothetical protein VEL28_11220, partial [Candidatus Binatia bacterium]|nr:hypothetical protein [Candidatus Binatia bacterium]